MADQPMSEQVPGLGVQQPTGTPALADLIRAYGGQHNPQGMTSTGPDFTGYNITQPKPANVQQLQPARDYASRGAANQAASQNIATQIGNITSKITHNIEERKFRENKQVFDTYTKSLTGLQQAQAQVQQAQAEKNKAIMALSKNPMDQEAAAALGKATQDEQKAQQAMQLNKTNLSDLFNGPKGEKHAKMLQKGFGIDDKNQDTPERKAAIQALQSSMGVDKQTASIASHQPQTMQLSPEAQQQQMMQQAGVVGKPASGGQQLQAEVKAVDQTLKGIKMADDVGLKTDDMISKLPAKGLKEVRDAQGNIEKNPDGTVKVRNLTVEELEGNPELAQKYQAEKIKMDAMVSNAQARTVTARASMIRAQKAGAAAKAATDPGQISYWAKALSDPTTGVTLDKVPAQARGMVLKAMADNGMKLQKPLTSDEIKRADLANNAVDNIKAAQEILKRRPDMFGPAGWGSTKFAKLLAGGDPDAIDFQADITLANLPAVGIHGVRGKWATEDLKKLDGNLYLNAESMGNVLGDIERSATEFSKMGGRKDLTTGSTSEPERPAGVPANYVYKKDGPKGEGYYKP